MASTIQLKRSTVPDKVPTTAQIDLGELAINTRDGKLYLKRENGNGTTSVIELGAVRSISGKTGDVTLTGSDVGLGAVDNTSDAEKPVSLTQAAALASKVETARQVATGDGLTGGGTLSSDRTIAADIATEAEAQAGVAAGKLMSARGAEQHMLANALGWGQTWQAPNRALNTRYLNETGRPILVCISSGWSTYGYIDVSENGASWITVARSRYGPTVSTIVPDGHYYRVTNSFDTWTELR